MKKITKILAGFVIALVLLGVFKNGIVQTVLSASISKFAHVPVGIGSTDVRFLSSFIDLRNIKVYNPSGFPERMMLDVPQILIDFDPAPLWKGRAHFEEVRLNVKELVVIKNRDGKLNLDAVKPTQRESQQQKEKRQEQAQPGGGKAPKIQIDKLYLSIGKVIYKDYSAGPNPKIQEFDINIQNRLYSNIDNPGAVVSLIMFEALTRSGLSRLAGMDLGVFQDTANGAFSKGMGLVGEGADKIESASKGILSLFKQ